MKNKKFVYLLLALSIVVWGGVFVKIYGVFVKEGSVPVKLADRTMAGIYHSDKDTFELMVNYKDPFFKRRTYHSVEQWQSSAVRPAAVKKDKTKAVKAEETIDWSFVQFKGTIKRKSTGKAISLLTVKDKEYFMEEGNQVEDIAVVKNCKDSVLIRYKGVSKYLKRQ